MILSCFFASLRSVIISRNQMLFLLPGTTGILSGVILHSSVIADMKKDCQSWQPLSIQGFYSDVRQNTCHQSSSVRKLVFTQPHVPL